MYARRPRFDERALRWPAAVASMSRSRFLRAASCSLSARAVLAELPPPEKTDFTALTAPDIDMPPPLEALGLEAVGLKPKGPRQALAIGVFPPNETNEPGGASGGSLGDPAQRKTMNANQPAPEAAALAQKEDLASKTGTEIDTARDDNRGHVTRPAKRPSFEDGHLSQEAFVHAAREWRPMRPLLRSPGDEVCGRGARDADFRCGEVLHQF
jgi:hypothetical protein